MSKRLSLQDFVSRAKKIHGNIYDYSMAEYKSMHTPITIICRDHGPFEQKPNNHLHGARCPKCFGKAKLTTEEFVERSQEVHGNNYDYSKTVYNGWEIKLTIICKKHGEFEQLPGNHLKRYGCYKCAGKQQTTKDFISKAKEIHGDRYDYSKTKYLGRENPVTIICKKHGEYDQLAGNHIHIIHKMGCPSCGKEQRSESLRSTTDQFIEKASLVHSKKYDYSTACYYTAKDKVAITCPKHGVFEQTPDSHLRGSGCPQCCDGPSSKIEEEVALFVESLGFVVRRNDRITIRPLEIDILIPDQMTAIEVHGLYWHSELSGQKPRAYHSKKRELCQNKGITLIQIFEDEWRDKKEIVKSILRHKLGKTSRKIYARNCSTSLISNPEWNDFLSENHIQGPVRSSVRIGIFHQNVLVGVMGFSKPRFSRKYDYELTRFCTKLEVSIPGALSKLLKFFRERYNYPSIISYADLRFSSGKGYEKLGFKFVHNSGPNPWYMKDHRFRESRIRYQKHKLVEAGNDPRKTEWEIMSGQGFDRIWDCGNSVWVI